MLGRISNFDFLGFKTAKEITNHQKKQLHHKIQTINHYQNQLQTADTVKKKALCSKIEQVKKNIVKLSLKDINAVKQLLDLYGLPRQARW